MNFVERLRELRAKTTPGPWAINGGKYIGTQSHGPIADCYNNADAALIVATINARHALLEVVEAAEDVLRGCDGFGPEKLQVEHLRNSLAALRGVKP